jgi:hypothetical protein
MTSQWKVMSNAYRQSQSTEGDMILYQRYMYNMRVLLPWELPVLPKGCVKDAIGVKYVSIACC